MPDHPLKNARRRLEWANGEITNLQTAVREFFKLKPYTVVVDEQSQPGRKIYKAEIFADIPDDWQRKVVHIAGDLRSPVDYAVRRVMEQDPVSFAQFKEHHRSLPVCRDAVALERELRQRKILAVYPVLGDFILQDIKPYPRGNRLLCNLDALNNSKKHRDLYPIGMAAPSMSVNMHIRSSSYFSLPGSAGGGYHLGSSEKSVVLFEIASDAEFDGNLQVSLDVALAQVEGFERQPLTRSLSEIANEVERILTAFEEKCFTPGHHSPPGT